MPVIHRLEQVSSEEKVGSLAENLMEALREHPDVEKKVSFTQLIFTVNSLKVDISVWLVVDEFHLFICN